MADGSSGQRRRGRAASATARRRAHADAGRADADDAQQAGGNGRDAERGRLMRSIERLISGLAPSNRAERRFFGIVPRRTAD